MSYNGIGLTTPRGSGTNGFVTRNLSTIRKTKEKIEDYRDKEDAAVRPFDIELIEHERRRQAEVRNVCNPYPNVAFTFSVIFV